jgi:hypothetical protein
MQQHISFHVYIHTGLRFITLARTHTIHHVLECKLYFRAKHILLAVHT